MYGQPDLIAYNSALRFHFNISPPLLLPFLVTSFPRLLSELLGFVPPMELQIMMCIFLLTRFAASIKFFCPIQSTNSGCPLGKPNLGRFVSSLTSPVGAGLALVQIMIASHPWSIESRTEFFSLVISQTTTFSGGILFDGPPMPDVPSNNALLESSDRTVPMGM